jgi:hypothetical protein
MQCSTLCGHITSKPLMGANRLDVSVMDPVTQAPSRYSTRYTLPVLIKPARACFTPLPLPRTCWCMAQMCAMLLRKPRLQNKAFSSGWTGRFMSGGKTIKVTPPSLLDMLSQSSQQCKATQSCHASGSNTPMLFSKSSASLLRHTSHVCTQE